MKPLDLGAHSWLVDLQYLGTPYLIACGVLESEAGLLLVDPGPATSLHTLERQLARRDTSLADVHALLLTHIHLDHAGAAGSIVAAHPHIQVYVHERGAPHLIRPGRLLKSARRLYGDEMDRLWGTMAPIPEPNVHALAGGETLRFGGRRLEVAYTPGHASHHVSYLDVASGTAFVGDTAGMRVMGTDYVLPVAPPPDIDVAAWHASLDRLRTWAPDRLFLTHFGPSDAVVDHLDALAERLDGWAGLVRESLEDDADDQTRAARFRERALAGIHAHVPADHRTPYERFGEPLASWHGLARYWRKQAAAS